MFSNTRFILEHPTQKQGLTWRLDFVIMLAMFITFLATCLTAVMGATGVPLGVQTDGPHALITFNPPTAAYVQVDVYDVLGRRVGSPYSDHAHGQFVTVWEAPTRGMWFVKARVNGERVATKRFVTFW